MTLQEIYGDKYRYTNRSTRRESDVVSLMREEKMALLSSQLRDVCADPVRRSRLLSHLMNDKPLRPFYPESPQCSEVQ